MLNNFKTFTLVVDKYLYETIRILIKIYSKYFFLFSFQNGLMLEILKLIN